MLSTLSSLYLPLVCTGNACNYIPCHLAVATCIRFTIAITRCKTEQSQKYIAFVQAELPRRIVTLYKKVMGHCPTEFMWT